MTSTSRRCCRSKSGLHQFLKSSHAALLAKMEKDKALDKDSRGRAEQRRHRVQEVVRVITPTPEAARAASPGDTDGVPS